jgi:CheY-like chemotaxis protein
MKQTTIWTIDDDCIYQIIISKTIKKSKLFSAQQNFTDPKGALKILKNNQNQAELLPDFILVDINMPQMDGWEFIERIRLLKGKMSKNTQVYLASSSISFEDKNKSKKYPEIVGFLSKPITIEDLKLIATQESTVLSPPSFAQY